MTDIIDAAPDSPEWIEARRTFIGASDVPAVLGLSPWRTPIDVWAEKVGLIPGGGGGTLATRLGHELEDLNARLWAETHPTAVVRHARQTVRHPDLPWLAASTDREVGDDGLLECKLVGGRQTAAWDDGAPLYVVAQVQAQLAVTGRRWCDVCSLHGGNGWDHRVQRVERDDDAISTMLVRLDRFWHEHVVTGARPELVGDPTQVRAAMAAAWPGDPDAMPVQLPASTLDLVADIKRSKALAKDLERDIKAAENELVALLGEATDGFVDPDQPPVVTYRVASRRSHDLKAIDTLDGFTADELAVVRRAIAAVERISTYRTLRLR